VGVLIQTGAEEVLFRGYLQQQLAARFASPIAWMVLPSAIFALPALPARDHGRQHLADDGGRLRLRAPRRRPDRRDMNWITNYVRPRINSIFSRREMPENLWSKCDECGTMLFHREMSDNLNVCTNCGHHMAITPRDRFERCSTAASSPRSRCPRRSPIPLQFRDQKTAIPTGCAPRRKATGEAEAMLVAEGEIGRTPIVAAAQDFSFMGGSMGMYVGNAIIAAAERGGEAEGAR
jgi:DNA-directed RNA polymerase subunit RPC12/RpoP